MAILITTLAGSCTSARVTTRAAVGPDRNPPCADRVEVRTRVIGKPDLSRNYWRGKYAEVEALVLEDGSLTEIRPIGGNDKKLMELLISAAPTWKFEPGSCGGKPERQWIALSIDCRPAKKAA